MNITDEIKKLRKLIRRAKVLREDIFTTVDPGYTGTRIRRDINYLNCLVEELEVILATYLLESDEEK